MLTSRTSLNFCRSVTVKVGFHRAERNCISDLCNGVAAYTILPRTDPDSVAVDSLCSGYTVCLQVGMQLLSKLKGRVRYDWVIRLKHTFIAEPMSLVLVRIVSSRH